jgi:diadenosine tetraphosphatase ApaH/serine/threonine PP2A family protein phosphatase
MGAMRGEPEPEQALAVTIPALALVVIAGEAQDVEAFTARWFAPEEVTRLDDDAVGEARPRIERRLAEGKLAAAIVTSHTSDLPIALARLAHANDVTPVALLLHDSEEWLGSRFPMGPHGFEQVLRLPAQGAPVTREPLTCDLRDERGPFDIIGDVHGCYDELLELFDRLGYVADAEAGMCPPEGRRAVFVGDLVDRGTGVVETLRLAMRMVAEGSAFCVPGNHDVKLLRALLGRHVWVTHGLRDSLEQIDRLPAVEAASLSAAFQAFMLGLPPYVVLDGGALVVAHAGLPDRFHGRVSGRVRSLALYGDVIGEDADGLPIRADWAADYRGPAAVVYGHTPQSEAIWRNNTINIDTGCVFGGALTAVRWPEREIMSVPARQTYARRGW